MLNFDETPENIQKEIKEAVFKEKGFVFLAEVISRGKVSILELVDNIEILKKEEYNNQNQLFYSKLNRLSFLLNENIKLFSKQENTDDPFAFHGSMLDNLTLQDLKEKSLKEFVANYIVDKRINVNSKPILKINSYRNISEHRELISSLYPKISYISAQYKKINLNEQFNDLTIYKNLDNDLENLNPTYIFIPGTAFIASEEGYTNFICSCITQLSNCQVIVVKPKLAPEYKPISILNELYYVIKNLLNDENSTLLQIDRNKIAIGGYSSGATLAILIAIQAKADGIVFNNQVLISPLTDLSRTISKNSKYQEFEAKDHCIGEEFVEWFLDLYLPDSINKIDPRISPYWCNPEKLKQLSATYLTFGEFDRFRGDAELYADKLSSINVPVYKIMFPQENHALLWKNNQVICSVAKQLKFLLQPVNIEKNFILDQFTIKNKRKKTPKLNIN